MSKLPQSITDAIESLSDLPGIGNRSAERLIFSLLKNESGLDQRISKSIGELKESICECEKCFNYSNENICPICADHGRDQSILCVVESPMDLIALDRTHEFHGVYHVLHGLISPLNKVMPEQLRINQLFKKIVQENNKVEEIILALAGNIEAEATSNFIAENLKNKGFEGRITILSRGIPSGGDLDYLDAGTVGRAVRDRREF